MSLFLIITSFLGAPGVIAHEWAHKKFCNWFGVKVHHVSYFRFGSLAGFVEHDTPKTLRQLFWISCGPLIINTTLTYCLASIAFHKIEHPVGKVVLLWLALAIGLHAIPSNHDAGNVLDASRSLIHTGGSFLLYFAYPFFGLIWLANRLKKFYFHFLFSLILIYLGFLIQ